MNQIVKALKETSAQAGTNKQWKLEELCKMAALEIDEKVATIARLTAANEAMQEDAVQNTYAFNLMLTANKAQSEEIRTLKQELETIKSCKHMHVIIHSRLYRPSTLEEPAEFEYKAECKDCGELFSADDVDEWAEVEE